MKNKYFLIFLTQIFLLINALANEEIEIIARIQSHGTGIQVVRSQEKDVIPSVLQNQQLNEIIATLKPGDEAIIKGQITYHASTVESQTTYRPFFVISSIKPISLTRLGMSSKEQKSNETQIYSKIEDYHHKYISFPISTEIASAVTMTTAALMMSSLPAAPTQPDTVTQINSGLILFAGALATGVFIFEQVTGKGLK